MQMRAVFLICIASLFGTSAQAQHIDKTRVMILGIFHMSNPGRDLHDVHADDVLAPKRQAEIAAMVSSLARFRPTQVDVEWDEAGVTKGYDEFIKGGLQGSHNEVVQLGFRLAKMASASVHGVDVDGDFPYDQVQAYAKSHGLNDILKAGDANIVKYVGSAQAILDSSSLSRTFRYMNDPAVIRESNSFYGETLKIGSGSQQPGADLLTAWYKRNAYICANIVQLAKPGDRVVVIFGAGHLTRLRNCVTEMPGFELVEPNDYLPK